MVVELAAVTAAAMVAVSLTLIISMWTCSATSLTGSSILREDLLLT